MPNVDLRVFSQEGSFILPGIGKQSTALAGGAKLLQRVMKCLLTTPGTDIFNPEWGGGLKASLPSTGSITPTLNETVLNEVAVSILRAETQILADQTGDNASSEELLDSLTLKDVSFDAKATAWNVQIAIKSKAGRVNVASVKA